MFIRCLASILLAGWLVVGAAAQDQTYLSLQTETTALQTGQEYEISIRLDNVPDLWLANVEIGYDPQRLYVIGTQAGSPVRTGPLFSGDSSIVVFNQVQNRQVQFAISQIAPADLVRGSGVMGTFRIYPLTAGTTTLSFRRAELRTMTITGEGENRIASNPQPVEFLPVILELTITGEDVEPPPEATATPTPTETPVPFVGATQPPQATALANVTLDPSLLGNGEDQPETDGDSPLLAVAIGAMLIGALGLVIVLLVWLRQRR